MVLDFVKRRVKRPNTFLPSPFFKCVLKERFIDSTIKAILAAEPRVTGHIDRASRSHAKRYGWPNSETAGACSPNFRGKGGAAKEGKVGVCP